MYAGWPNGYIMCVYWEETVSGEGCQKLTLSTNCVLHRRKLVTPGYMYIFIDIYVRKDNKLSFNYISDVHSETSVFLFGN